MPHPTTTTSAINPLPNASSLQGNHPHGITTTKLVVLAPTPQGMNPILHHEGAKVTTASTRDQDPNNITIMSTSSPSSPSQDIHMQSSPISRSNVETIRASERPVPSAPPSAAGTSDPMAFKSSQQGIVPSFISGTVEPISTIRPVIPSAASAVTDHDAMAALHHYRSIQSHDRSRQLSSISRSDDVETSSATRPLPVASQSSTGRTSDPVMSSASSQDRMPSCTSRSVETSSTRPSSTSSDAIMSLSQQGMHMPSSIARSVEASSAIRPLPVASQSSTGRTSDPIMSASSHDRMPSCTSRSVETSSTRPSATSSDAIMSSSQQGMHMPSSISRSVEASSARPVPVPSNPSVRPSIENKKHTAAAAAAAAKIGKSSPVSNDPKRRKMSKIGTVSQIRTRIFRTHLHAVMRAGGWNVREKFRATDTERAPDVYYFPPGVEACRPFKPRVHYFDSKVDLRKYMIKNASQDKVSSYVLVFDDRLRMLLRSERGKRIKTEADRLDDGLEVMTEKFITIVEEEMVLDELDQSIKGRSHASSDAKKSPLQSSIAKEQKPPPVGEKALISPKQEELKTAPVHPPPSKKRPRQDPLPTSSREPDPTASAKRKKMHIADSPQSSLNNPLQSLTAEEQKPAPVGEKAILSPRKGELKAAPVHPSPSQKRPRKEPVPTSPRESDPTDSAKRKDMNIRIDDYPQSLFVVNKKLPKYIGNTRKLLFPRKVIEKFEQNILSAISKQDSSATSSSGVLKIVCLDIRNEPDSVRIRTQGR
eukprot:scaffold89155_cov45-Attheya_sp.AAC.1